MSHESGRELSTSLEASRCPRRGILIRPPEIPTVGVPRGVPPGVIPLRTSREQ